MKKRSQTDEGYLVEAAETSTLCRFVINCFLAELYYLPYFCATTFREKVSVERHLNSVLNLDRARKEKIIANWSIQWQWKTNTQYPRWPYKIFIRLTAGKLLKLELPRPLLAEISRIRKDGLTTPIID